MRWLLLLCLIWLLGCGAGTTDGQQTKKRPLSNPKQMSSQKRRELIDKVQNLLAEGEMFYAKMCDADGFKKSSFYHKSNARVTEALKILHQLRKHFPNDDEIMRVTQKAQRLKEAIIKDSPIN